MPNPKRRSRVPADEKAEPPEQLLQRLRTVVHAELYEGIPGKDWRIAMSRVLPILFNMDMVRAILDGRKTVTRRKVKNPAKPPCLAGDILYVRETWAEIKNADSSHIKYVYRATDTYPFGVKGYIVKFKWRPSIHMPKKAARIWLKVTDVRVERLQDMSRDDAIKEGIHYCECPDGYTWKEQADMNKCYITTMWAMKALWNSTIKKSGIDLYGWDANPWVWVIEFELCEKPEILRI